MRDMLAQDLQARGLIAPGLRWEPLSGGRTNYLWRVEVEQGAMAVKLYPEDRQTPLFRNDGIAEAAVLRALDGQGLSAALHVSAMTRLGPCVIYRHVDGASWAGNPAPVGRLLARLHGLPVAISLPHAPSGSEALRKQGLGILSECGSAARNRVRAAMPGASVPPLEARRLLHGDVVANNILMTGDGPRLIDWQCPALGEPSADIAIFLSPAMQRLYGGTAPDPAFCARFFTAYGCRETAQRYRALSPWYHWRMAAYCLWKAERGAGEYRDAMALELPALERARAVSHPIGRPISPRTGNRQ